MNKTERINEFFKLIASIHLSDSSIEITPEMVYANIVEFGIREHSKNNVYFNEWRRNFKDVKNIHVFVSEVNPYFCQFVNNVSLDNNEEKFIKIYVPIDGKHINKAADTIFKFMAKKNIAHTSLVGSDERIDNIVIRVKDEKSARLIKQFIKNDPYIQEGLLPPNPFAIIDEGLAMAYDNKISYNKLVASYISSYLNDLKSKDNLETTNYVDFANYVIKKYNNTFVYCNELNDFIKEKNLYGDKEYIAKKLIEYVTVTKLLIDSLRNLGINEYMEYWHEINNRGYQKLLINDIIKNLENYYYTEEKGDKLSISEIDKILADAIAITCEKYDLSQATHALNEFINNNNVSYFTNDNDSREKIIKNVTVDDAKKLIKNLFDGELNLTEYVSYALNLDVLLQKQQILDNAALVTLQKYGDEQLCYALEQASKGNFQGFSRENRESLIRNIPPDEIPSFIEMTFKREGHDLKNSNEPLNQLYAKRIQNMMIKNNMGNKRI